MRKIRAQETGARPALGGEDRESRILPAELTSDGEQKEREEGGSQQRFEDSQDAAPRIDGRVLRISLKGGRINGRDSALDNQFSFGPEIVCPSVLPIPDAAVGRDCAGGRGTISRYGLIGTSGSICFNLAKCWR
jgi:hypothetical protein